MTTQACTQTACPLREGGRCLEGFNPPEDCPFFILDDASLTSGSGAVAGVGSTRLEESSGIDHPESHVNEPSSLEVHVNEDPAESGTREEPVVFLGGDEALDSSEASRFMQSVRCTVVLVAGTVESGKTTLVVELFAQYLLGGFADWSFAGSKTLKAIDDRHRTARVSSGLLTPTTERTRDEDMRLLHLRLANGKRRVEFLFSDVKGEFFEGVIDGRAVAHDVPIASRADLAVVLIDGAVVGDLSTRSSAITNARQLIGGLAGSGGLAEGTRLLIVCSKYDLLDAGGREYLQAKLSGLLDFASRYGLLPEAATLAARPSNGSRAEGLDGFLNWLVNSTSEQTPGARASMGTYPDEANDRYSWRTNDYRAN